MVDYNRQLLDELMGRNRNMDPNSAQAHIKTWEDPEFCRFFLHSFCPHDLFVNTRADLGPCGKIHCEETKRNYAEAPESKKQEIGNDFYRFCSNMINEVDRKILKGKQRLDLMNSKLELRPVSKQQEQINSIHEKVQKLVREAEEAGIRGDVDQAQNLMTLCDKLKEDKEALIRQYEQYGFNLASEHQDKQMEVCEICSAFLIIGDAQSRIDDHLMGKQHIGYTRLRKAIEDYRSTSSRLNDRQRSGSSGGSSRRRDERPRHRERENHHHRDRRDDRRDRDRQNRHDRDRRDSRDKHRHRRDRDRSRS